MGGEMIDLYVPKQVVIGPHEYEVSFDHNIRLDDGHNGQIHYRNQTIKLDNCEPQTQLEAIFMHEVLHGITDVFNITLDEADNDRLANGLVMFLKENFGARFNFEGVKDN